MTHSDIPHQEIFEKILDSLDICIFTFDESRKITFSNSVAKKMTSLPTPGSKFGSEELDHFKKNQYYDEQGNILPYPKDSVIDRALQGLETHNLLLEHRNKENHTGRWLSISCVPVKNAQGKFQYGIVWYSDVSTQKSREDKLKFLIKATGILSLHMDFEKRMLEKAKLCVPSLADWCAVDIVQDDSSVKRIILIHRDPKKIEWIKEYEKKYPQKAGVETNIQRIIRTHKAEFTPIVKEEMIDTATNITEQQKRDIKLLELSSIITVPIGTGTKVLGVLTLAYAESGRTYTDEDFEFVQEFANHLSVLLENARLYNEISQRDLSKDMFLASLSHELRNPLAPIRTSLELLKLKNIDSTFKEELDIIMHQFGHMTRLLNDLLDATRFTKGKINITREPTELTLILEQVIKAIKPVFEESNIDLHVSLPSKQYYLLADRMRLEQAFRNILSNAVKFTPPGGAVWVTITEHKDTVSISIKDNGVGITHEEMKHIFEPYYQGISAKDRSMGLGIGLFLVYQIINLHGGTIQATSEGSNTGSQFTIRLPFINTDYEIQKNTIPMPRATESKIKKILIVDDNKVAANALVRLLTALGWEAVAVYSGKETLSFLEKNTIDIILLDIGMPDMTGYELVRTIKQNNKYSTLPIVAVTGYGLEDDKIKAIQSGFNAHITKPIGARDLREILTGDIVA